MRFADGVRAAILNAEDATVNIENDLVEIHNSIGICRSIPTSAATITVTINPRYKGDVLHAAELDAARVHGSGSRWAMPT